jgi:hypothetical protein
MVQAKYRSVSVQIRQTKRVPALTEEIVQSGHLWLEPGKSFRWQLGKPLPAGSFAVKRAAYQWE